MRSQLALTADLFFSLLSSSAQTMTTGTIVGDVTDAAGAVVRERRRLARLFARPPPDQFPFELPE